MNKTPEQLRAEYLAAEQRRDAELTRKGKRNYLKWMFVGAMASVVSAVVNYFSLSPMVLLHAVYGGFAAALLLRLKRGPWTGIALIGLGNQAISLFAGTVSLLGFLLFLPAGGIIGFTDAVPDEDFICRLHAIIMRGSSGGRPRERSSYRHDNLRVGNFVYVPPAHEDVPALMADLAAWATGPGQSLPRPLFAAVLAYQFVTIHPFHDGNGRTCRALATWALRGPDDATAIDPLGLLNVEEFYAADLDGYYAALQMDCHFSYYDHNEHGSRSDPDLSPWIGYVLTMLARSAEQVGRSIAERFRTTHADLLSDPVAAWPRTFRRLVIHRTDALAPFGPAEVADVLQVSDRTARTWLQSWHEAGLIVPQRPDTQRVHAWALAPAIATVIAREMAP